MEQNICTTMNPDKIFDKLQATFKKKQENGFIPRNEAKTFDEWVIVAYAIAPIAKVVMDDGLEFPAPVLPHQLKLFKLQNEKKKCSEMVINNRKLNKIPEREMAPPLRSMASPFAILPITLDDFQMRRIADYENLFAYTSVYIIREAWGKSLCELPKIDNKLKPLANAWSERWFWIFKLCVNCRDFLTKPEQKKILNSWDWLDLIIQECRTSNILQLTNSDDVAHTKNTIVSQERNFADVLRKYGNPCDSATEPSLYRLIEISTKIAEKAENFRRDFWNPYINSIYHWANVLEHDPYANVVKSQDGHQKREQRGKRIKTLVQSAKSTIIK